MSVVFVAWLIAGVVGLRQTVERIARVIVSIAWRPFCVASTRAWVSAVRFMTWSSSANVASRITVAIISAVRSSGSVCPSARRSRASISTSRPC